VTSETRQQVDEARKSRTREKLLDAATAVFLRDGFHATLISDIVAEAGVGQGTFYRHFQSKREVFEALVERLVSRLLVEFQPMSDKLPDTFEEYIEASRGVVTRMARVLESQRDMVLLVLREAAAIDRAFEAKVEEIYDSFAMQTQLFIDHAVRTGFARPCHTPAVAQALVGMGLRLLRLWLLGRLPAANVEDALFEFVEFAFRGMDGRSSRPPETPPAV
jgi:AcrR family transcriptional regulator